MKQKLIAGGIILSLLLLSFTSISVGRKNLAKQKIKNNAPSPKVIKSSNKDGKTEQWAIIVGTRWEDPFFGTKFSTRTAKTMYRVLLRHNWKQENIRLLLEEEATKKNISESFTWINKQGADEDDIVLFFFSGHGLYYPEDQEPYDEHKGKDGKMLPYDYWNSITDDDLSALLKRLIPQTIVAIITACNSGSFIDGGDCDPSNITDKQCVILTACRIKEKTLPNVLGINHFTFYLVLGLNGMADRFGGNKDGQVSIEEAFAFARPLTTINTKPFGPPAVNHPQICDHYKGECIIT